MQTTTIPPSEKTSTIWGFILLAVIGAPAAYFHGRERLVTRQLEEARAEIAALRRAPKAPAPVCPAPPACPVLIDPAFKAAPFLGVPRLPVRVEKDTDTLDKWKEALDQCEQDSFCPPALIRRYRALVKNMQRDRTWAYCATSSSAQAHGVLACVAHLGGMTSPSSGE